jgi:hypothetical protein
MEANEFFETIVVPNYKETKHASNDLRLIYNAILSMNTAAEYVALERLKYGELIKKQISDEAYKIRAAFSTLADLNDCAVTLKHVRKHDFKDGALTATSTNFSPSQPSSWTIDFDGRTLNLVEVLDSAFATLTLEFDELR